VANKKENLFKLRELVEELSDRDNKIKSDLHMFESVFDNFPIPVYFWTVNPDGKLYSKKISGDEKSWEIINREAECVKDMFACPNVQRDIDIRWDAAISGESQNFISNTGECYLFTRMMPLIGKNKTIEGITGLSWDISSNFKIMNNLKEIHDITGLSPRIQHKDKVRKLAEEALDASRLRKIVKQQESGE
jgi:hypothetical protein